MQRLSIKPQNDAIDRLTDVEYLSTNQDIEDFSAMDNLGNRTGTITQRDSVRHYTTDALTISNPCRMDTHSVRAEIGLARMSDLHSPSINRHRRRAYVTDTISTT